MIARTPCGRSRSNARHSMPSEYVIFAKNQPVTYVIEAIRSLVVGAPMVNHGWRLSLSASESPPS